MRALPLPLNCASVVADRYRVQRRIAEGGIGEVWSAVDVRTQRAVVLKRLRPAVAHVVQVQARFQLEVDLLGKIYSEFVVHRVEQCRDPHYGHVLVEEFVEGEPLSAVLSRRSLAVEEARELGFNLLRALVALERAGVVHGDLKPANLILRPLAGGRLRPILIDFGAACRLGHAVAQGDVGIGTLEYMAPEQLTPASLTHAADLYAVGAILYRAVKGRHPFGEARGRELAQKKLTQSAPPLASGRSDWTAQRLEAVVMRALERMPADRYQHADDMLTELMRLQ
jgi:serine/threonine-protein kinase